MKKGFTLVELLAVLVLLSIITIIAVPNVIGIIENNKSNTYISQAKMFVAQAEATLNASTTIHKPNDSTTITKIYLSRVETTDIDGGPDNNKFSHAESFVAVALKGGRLQYYVYLVGIDKSNHRKGVDLVEVSKLSDEDRYSYVSEGISAPTDPDLKLKMGMDESSVIHTFK